MKVIYVDLSLQVLCDFLAGRMAAAQVFRLSAPGVDLYEAPEDLRCIDVTRPAEPGAPARVFLTSHRFPVVPEGNRIPRGQLEYKAARQGSSVAFWKDVEGSEWAV